jgi:hypothetical protein
MVNMSNCPSCERELQKDMMFCPYCGSKVHSENVTEGASLKEQVEGVIPMAMAKGGDDDGSLYTLIVTNTRLLLAKNTEEDTNRIGKAFGSVLFGGSILEPERHRKSLGAYSRRFQSMEPEAILAESKENSFLRIAEVSSIRISSEEDPDGNMYYLLAFETTNGSKRYLIPNDKDARELLISTFGGKVHW